MDPEVARRFASGLTIALGGLGPAIAIGLGAAGRRVAVIVGLTHH